MVTKEELVEYIRSSFERGATREEIRQKLLAHNWANEKINEAFELLQGRQVIKDSRYSTNAKKVPKTMKFTLIILFAVITLLIIGVIVYFVFSISSSESEAGGIESISDLMKCEVNGDCEGGFECIEKICVEVSQTDSSTGSQVNSGSSKTSSRRTTSGGGGGSGEGSQLTSADGITDCGTDLDCFISSAEICSLARVTHKYEIKLFGIFTDSKTMNYELKGEEDDKCLFYLKDEKEKEGTCKISAKDLVETLKVWKNDSLQVGTFSDEVWKNSKCEGSYFS